MSKFQEYRLLSRKVRKSRADLFKKYMDMVSSHGIPEEKVGNWDNDGCVSWANMFITANAFALNYCRNFQEDSHCESKECPFYTRQVDLADASIEYNNAIKARRDFIKGLFHRSK